MIKSSTSENILTKIYKLNLRNLYQLRKPNASTLYGTALFHTIFYRHLEIKNLKREFQFDFAISQN